MRKVIISIYAFILGFIVGAYALATILYKPIKNVKKRLDDYKAMLDKEIERKMDETLSLIKEYEALKDNSEK